MACHYYRSPDGQVDAIICSRTRRRRCHVCRAWASLECDYPDSKRRTGTCDKPLCVNCAQKGSGGRDYCPSHPWQKKQVPLFEPPAFEQLPLFSGTQTRR